MSKQDQRIVGQHKARVIELQRQLKIARDALERVKSGARDPEGTAALALDKMWPLEPKQPLQGLVGHGGKR